MIRPLRQRHRHVISAMGILLPMVCAAAIVTRRPIPDALSLPASFTDATTEFNVQIWSRPDLFDQATIQTRLLGMNSGSDKLAVAFTAPPDFERPDLLIYWVPGSNGISNTLPDAAELLGAFSPAKPLPLPADARSADGRFLLFSLADQEIVSVSKPVSLRKP